MVSGIKKALGTSGFSFIEVLQPAIPYHKWEEYKDKIEYLNEDPKTMNEALILARKKNRFTLGIFYREKRRVYHRSLYNSLNPVKNSLSREKRLKKINRILKL